MSNTYGNTVSLTDSSGQELQLAVSGTDHTYTKSHAATGSGDAVNFRGYFNISITGSWTGTVDIEVSSDQSTWRVITDGSFTANAEKVGFEPAGNQYFRSTFTRTGGTAVVRMYQ